MRSHALKLSLLLPLSLIVASSSAHALPDPVFGSAWLDPATGLQWVRADKTGGIAFSEIGTGTYQHYRHATETELLALMTSLGMVERFQLGYGQAQYPAQRAGFLQIQGLFGFTHLSGPGLEFVDTSARVASGSWISLSDGLNDSVMMATSLIASTTSSIATLDFPLCGNFVDCGQATTPSGAMTAVETRGYILGTETLYEFHWLVRTWADSDEDGLSDTDEWTLGTDLLDPDSDDDGALDGIEVAAGTNPLDPLDFPPPPVPLLGAGASALLGLLLAALGIARSGDRR